MTDNEKEPQAITHVNVPFKSGELSPALPESSTQLPTVPEEPSLMNLIAEMARDNNADINKLQSLIQMKNSYEDREAKKEFARDYIRMKPKLPRVISLHKNTQTNSQYAKLEDINKIIDPILAEHNFATSHKVIAQTEKTVTVRVELWHSVGHIESTELTMPLDDLGIAGKVNKTAPHAIASTIMYLRRVGECALLNISTGQDVDGNQPKPKDEPISIEQAAELDIRLRALGGDALARFLRWSKIEQLTELSTRNYPAAVKAISASEAEAAKSKVQ